MPSTTSAASSSRRPVSTPPATAASPAIAPQVPAAAQPALFSSDVSELGATHNATPAPTDWEARSLAQRLKWADEYVASARAHGRKISVLGGLDAPATLGDVFNPFRRKKPQLTPKDQVFVDALKARGYDVYFQANTSDFLTPYWSARAKL